MGTKSCTKILIFSTRFSCHRRFRNAPYGEKILLMGKYVAFRRKALFVEGVSEFVKVAGI